MAAAATKDTKGSWTTSVDKGEFKRKESVFRNWIKADGEFPPESGRYHLYVSLACPWAHRCLIVRGLKGLEKAISVTVVDWFLGDKGWTFTSSKPKCEADPVFGFERLRQVYEFVDPEYGGNITVPVLFDKKTKRIVSNESSEIIQMLNNQFNEFSATAEQAKLDLYPAELKAACDEINEYIYPNINNGVYRAGFATEQGPYDTAYKGLFEALDRVEGILSKQRYLTGDRMTLSDVRLFTTLIRFDRVYHTHFKCDRKKISEYPALDGFTRELYQHPHIHPTVDFEHCQKHYMTSHKSINPHGIVAHGPPIELLDQPHGRDKLFGAAK